MAIQESASTVLGVPPDSARFRSAVDQKIANELKSISKDNDSIYFQPVPSISPPEPAAAVMAKLIPFPLEPSDGGSDPFARLIPPQVRQEAGNLQRHLRHMASTAGEEEAKLSKLTEDQLSTLGLPGALRALEDQAGISDSLWDRILQFRAQGGLVNLRQLFSTLTSLADSAKEQSSAIEQCLAQIEQERDADRELRVRFGSKWNCLSPEEFARSFRAELDGPLRFLNTSVLPANEKIGQELVEVSPSLQQLESIDRAQLEQQIPRLTESERLTPEAQAVSAALHRIDVNKHERAALVAELDRLASTTDAFGMLTGSASPSSSAASQSRLPILALSSLSLSSSSSSSPEARTAEFITEHVRPKQARLEVLRSEHPTLLRELSTANEAFVRTRTDNEITRARQAKLQEIEHAIATAARLQQVFSAGVTNMSAFIEDALVTVKRNIDDCRLARDQHKQSLLDSLSRQAARIPAVSPGLVVANPLPPAAVYPAPGTPSPVLGTGHVSSPSMPHLQHAAPVLPQSAVGHARAQSSPFIPSSSPTIPHQTYPQTMFQHPPGGYPVGQQQQQHHVYAPPPTLTPAPAPVPVPGVPAGLPMTQWPCPACTFHNNAMNPTCQMCGYRRV